MDKSSLITSIADLIRQVAPDTAKPRPKGFALHMRPSGPQASEPQQLADQIAEDLVTEAIQSGLPLSNRTVSRQELGGGNTAELVSELTINASFVLKVDSKSQKLAKEAQVMRFAKSHKSLTQKCRDAWPVVYAIRDKPPYAYLMEYFPKDQGWLSLQDRLYPGQGSSATSAIDAVRFIHPVLDILFGTYEHSKDQRILPSLAEDYVGRIKERLEAVGHDKRFASQELLINGTPVRPWMDYVDLLEANKGGIASITPSFTTIAHGDPNPGNVMLRSTTSEIEVKLIDPKEWQTGDYLFDIAKLTHFLLGTGPIESPASGEPIRVTYLDDVDTTSILYQIDRPTWTQDLVDACMERTQEFAEANGDAQWRARYELGMAANLLGLPAGRLKKGRHDAALALYAEGLIWLDRFCKRLTSAGAGSQPQAVVPESLEVEPTALAGARQRVRQDAHPVTETQDRRGFQLLHWQPSRRNGAGKPVELSLEHEARLTPACAADLARLKDALAASLDLASSNALLPDDPQFSGWTVQRIPRDPGMQSRDLYWENTSPTSNAKLIHRKLTFRERVAGSSFMTWEPIGSEHPLNLELPFEAYGGTGVVARLEFNWIDAIDDTLSEFDNAAPAGPTNNPLVLASRIVKIEKGEFKAVLEHSTFREKYLLKDGDTELFHLNVDHVVSQSLTTHRIASFTDVDIAPTRFVDLEMLTLLICFTLAMRQQYNLLPVDATKALTGARMTNE